MIFWVKCPLFLMCTTMHSACMEPLNPWSWPWILRQLFFIHNRGFTKGIPWSCSLCHGNSENPYDSPGATPRDDNFGVFGWCFYLGSSWNDSFGFLRSEVITEDCYFWRLAESEVSSKAVPEDWPDSITFKLTGIDILRTPLGNGDMLQLSVSTRQNQKLVCGLRCLC